MGVTACWVHKDSSTLFAGLIYLNRVPEKDTGTDLYIEKDGYAWTENDDTIIEHKHYSGEQVLDEDYEKAYNRVQSQYELSISFENVFIISHKTDMIADKFNNVMRFEKAGNFTRIIE